MHFPQDFHIGSQCTAAWQCGVTVHCRLAMRDQKCNLMHDPPAYLACHIEDCPQSLLQNLNGNVTRVREEMGGDLPQESLVPLSRQQPLLEQVLVVRVPTSAHGDEAAFELRGLGIHKHRCQPLLPALHVQHLVHRLHSPVIGLFLSCTPTVKCNASLKTRLNLSMTQAEPNSSCARS